MKDWHTTTDTFEDGEATRREECKKEIDDVFKTINSDQSEYDKQLLTLSSAFLAVSLAFVKDVVPLNSAIDLPALYAAFVLFALCILMVLASYQLSIWGHFRAKKYWEKRLGENGEAKFPYRHATLVRTINLVTGILFAAGVSSVVIFVVLNLSKGEPMSNNTATPSRETVEKGANIKTPPMPAPQRAPSPNPGANNQSKKS